MGFNTTLQDRTIRNINRRRTTVNRYVTDSNSYWREQLHPRIAHLNVKPGILEIINKRVQDNVFGFPCDIQSTSNTMQVFNALTEDYLNFVEGRRSARYTETNGFWTEQQIAKEFTHAFILALWDIGSQFLIDNYPLNADDLRHRTGRTFSADNRRTYHDSRSKVGAGSSQETYHDSQSMVASDSQHETTHDNTNATGTHEQRETGHESKSKTATDEARHTRHDNTRNKIHETHEAAQGDTLNNRTTDNTIDVQDTFLSPQNQGVTPSTQSSNVLNRPPNGVLQSPDNMGVSEMVNNGSNGMFTTNTGVLNSGTTSTISEGRTRTNQAADTRVDERDYLEEHTNTGSDLEAHHDLNSKAVQGSEINAGNDLTGRATQGSEMRGNNDMGGRAQTHEDKEGHNDIGTEAQQNTHHERFQDLDISGVLQEFYDLFNERLMQELDNRLMPLFLNMKIARFVDHRTGRGHYV